MSERVCAIVVTYNRPALLRECLQALQNQTRRVDLILAVDNASTDDTREIVAREFPDVEILALPSNGGGAGGFHAGMKWAFEQSFDWLWLMDDDGRPAPECLENLLRRTALHAPTAHPQSIAVPMQQDADGRLYGFAVWHKREIDVTAQVVAGRAPTQGVPLFSFVGPLISRAVVEKIGLPNKEFFIWFDDFEYALRASHRSRARVEFVPDALFYHDFGGPARTVQVMGRTSIRRSPAPWKEYYGARNSLYSLTRNQRRPRDLLHYFFGIQMRCLVGDIIYEPDRWIRVRMRLKGIRDGLLGRLGKRVSPTRKPDKRKSQ